MVDFGLMGIALLTMSALETFSSFGFGQALIQKKENTNDYLDAAWTVLIIRGLIVFIIVYLVAPYVAFFFHTPEVKPIIRVLGLVTFFQAFSNIGVIFFQKELEFNKVFIYRFVEISTNFIVAVLAAIILRNVWALVLGLLAEKIVSVIISYLIHPYRPHLKEGYQVIGIDNLNDYYDVNLKFWRLEKLKRHSNFIFYKISVENYHELKTIFRENCPEGVINLAARAGVRYSLENPFAYLDTNSGGNLNLLELCREYGVPKFVLASTSSLYAGQKMPFKENLPVNTPISPYAASKKAAEMMAYTYHYLYKLDVTILRYFTVYGPAGRPDMATFRFIRWIRENVPLEIFGDGNQKRDFTYVDDIARGTIGALTPLGYEIINLGNNHPYGLSEVIKLMEKSIGKKAQFNYKEFHQADMQATWSDISKAQDLLNWQPQVSLEEGIKKTIEWTENNWQWVQKIKV